MTAIIGNKQDKTRSLDILSEIIQKFVVNGLTHEQAEGVALHMAWLRQQTADLNVNCKLETVPELQLTRVVLEYSFLPIPPLKSN